MNRNINFFDRKCCRQLSRRALLWIILALSAILIVLLFLALANAGLGSENRLKGSWSNENATIIQFDGLGRGSLITDDLLGKFSYEIKADMVRIDFASDRWSDCTYTFELEHDTLILVDNQGNKTVFNRTD